MYLCSYILNWFIELNLIVFDHFWPSKLVVSCGVAVHSHFSLYFIFNHVISHRHIVRTAFYQQSVVVVGGLVAKLCPTLETPWIVASQAPLSMEFSRQECCSGLPFPSPGDLPNPGIKPTSPALQADSLLLSHQGIPLNSSLVNSYTRLVIDWALQIQMGMPVFSFEKLDYYICCLTLYLEDYFIII